MLTKPSTLYYPLPITVSSLPKSPPAYSEDAEDNPDTVTTASASVSVEKSYSIQTSHSYSSPAFSNHPTSSPSRSYFPCPRLELSVLSDCTVSSDSSWRWLLKRSSCVDSNTVSYILFVSNEYSSSTRRRWRALLDPCRLSTKPPTIADGMAMVSLATCLYYTDGA